MERYDIIRALGIEVLPAASITRRALLLTDEDVALVRPDLPDRDHDDLVDWLLPRAVDRATRNRHRL